MFWQKKVEFKAGHQISLQLDLIDKVELQTCVGEGGFGQVWQAADVSTGQVYALKVIRGVQPGSVMESRVRLEADVRINSSYVAPVYGLRQWDDTTYLILFEYVPGASLQQLLNGGRLSGTQRLAIFQQILTGVADAHRHNIIHRDLKPSNVLVNPLGQVKIIDFGISKFKDKKVTVSGQIMGTPAYLAPELLFLGAKQADARADIYSLGQMFYELAMGQHFWEHRGFTHLADFLSFVKRVTVPAIGIDLSDFACDFYPKAATMIRRMVMIEREQRYASVAEVLADLGYEYRVTTDSAADIHLGSPVLVIETGSNREAKLVLGLRNGERRVIGRADVAGSDASISRRHLEFSREDNRYFVRDLGSKNGTLVRGLALEPDDPAVDIQPDDRLKIGDIFMRFVALPGQGA